MRPEADAARIVVDTEAAPDSWLSERKMAFASMALVTAMLIAGVVAIDPWHPRPRQEVTASATPTPIWDLTQLSDAAKWGHVWSIASGVPVLRPMWLPAAASGYSTGFSVEGGTSGLGRYRFWYYANGPTAPPTAVRSIEIMAAREDLGLGLTQLEAAPEAVIVGGHAAELVGTDVVPVWEIAWSSFGYRYGVQVFGHSRDDALRVANSLANVVDHQGNVAP